MHIYTCTQITAIRILQCIYRYVTAIVYYCNTYYCNEIFAMKPTDGINSQNHVKTHMKIHVLYG